MSCRLILDGSATHLLFMHPWNVPECGRLQRLHALRPWKILRGHGIDRHLWLVSCRLVLLGRMQLVERKRVVWHGQLLDCR